MGFIEPAPPPFDDVEEWKAKSHLERIKPLAQDWALNGFGTPVAVYFLYIIKILVYVGLGALAIFATSGWPSWTDPIVFQKAVIWTMLWEVLGLGAELIAVDPETGLHRKGDTIGVSCSPSSVCMICMTTCGSRLVVAVPVPTTVTEKRVGAKDAAIARQLDISRDQVRNRLAPAT